MAVLAHGAEHDRSVPKHRGFVDSEVWALKLPRRMVRRLYNHGAIPRFSGSGNLNMARERTMNSAWQYGSQSRPVDNKTERDQEQE